MVKAAVLEDVRKYVGADSYGKDAIEAVALAKTGWVNSNSPQ